jgi:hypothetical protein
MDAIFVIISVENGGEWRGTVGIVAAPGYQRINEVSK